MFVMRTVVLLLVGLVASGGCTKANPNQCCTDQADCNAKGIPVDMQCGDGLVCRGNQCIAEVCTSSADCDLSAPFCVDTSCMATCAADNQCPGNGGSAENVYCVSGACVTCRDAMDCPSAAPICNMGSCRACAADTDCSSGACDLDAGTCIAETSIAYLSPTGSASSDCSKADPCSLARALVVVDVTRPNLKLTGGSYTGNLQFTGTFGLNVYGPGTLSYFISIQSAGGTLRLRDLDIAGSLTCAASTSNTAKPTLDAERVTVTTDGQNGLPFSSDQCIVRLVDVAVTLTGLGTAMFVEGYAGSGGTMATFDRVRLSGGDPGINLRDQSTLTVTNSIFVNQGTTNGAIQLQTGTGGNETGSVSFSTFYNSLLKCPASNTVLTSSNNIFVNESSGAPANTVTGTACSHTYDLIKPQAAAVGATNLLGMDPRFVNAAMGDFHLMTGSPAIDAADPAATLTSDYDGTARPQGSARDIGAFEYKP